MKLKKLIIGYLCISVLLSGATLKGNTADTISLINKPLLYLKFNHWKNYLDKVENSDYFNQFLQSFSFKNFKKSRLYLKLEAKLSGFSKLIGFKLNFKNLKKLTNKSLRFAFLNIKDLKFWTILEYNDAEEIKISPVYQNISKMQKSLFLNKEYYFMKNFDIEVYIYQFYNKRFLFLTNDFSTLCAIIKIDKGENFIQKFERNLLSQKLQSVQSEIDSFNYDIYLWLNLKALLKNHYFKSYFIFYKYIKQKILNEAVILAKLNSKIGMTFKKFYVLNQNITNKILNIKLENPYNYDLVIHTCLFDKYEFINFIGKLISFNFNTEKFLQKFPDKNKIKIKNSEIIFITNSENSDNKKFVLLIKLNFRVEKLLKGIFDFILFPFKLKKELKFKNKNIITISILPFINLYLKKEKNYIILTNTLNLLSNLQIKPFKNEKNIVAEYFFNLKNLSYTLPADFKKYSKAQYWYDFSTQDFFNKNLPSIIKLIHGYKSITAQIKLLKENVYVFTEYWKK